MQEDAKKTEKVIFFFLSHSGCSSLCCSTEFLVEFPSVATNLCVSKHTHSPSIKQSIFWTLEEQIIKLVLLRGLVHHLSHKSKITWWKSTCYCFFFCFLFLPPSKIQMLLNVPFLLYMGSNWNKVKIASSSLTTNQFSSTSLSHSLFLTLSLSRAESCFMFSFKQAHAWVGNRICVTPFRSFYLSSLLPSADLCLTIPGLWCCVECKCSWWLTWYQRAL